MIIWFSEIGISFVRGGGSEPPACDSRPLAITFSVEDGLDYRYYYDTDTSKWYIRNNQGQYEEYGRYDASSATTYEGKLIVSDGYEYEWDGTQWVNLGEATVIPREKCIFYKTDDNLTRNFRFFSGDTPSQNFYDADLDMCVAIFDTPLASIPYQGFHDAAGVTHIYLPNTITSLEGECFSGMHTLQYLYLPSGLTSIGSLVFWYSWRNDGGYSVVDFGNERTSTISLSGVGGLPSGSKAIVPDSLYNSSWSLDGFTKTKFSDYYPQGTSYPEISSLPKTYPSIDTYENWADSDYDYSETYNTEDSKWYMRNNLGHYEEYGVYADSIDSGVTTYEGKLALYDGHEYEFSGGTWVDLGEVQGGGPSPSENMTFEDANVKSICVSNWGSDGEITYGQAAAVTDIGTVFRGNTSITKFDEFRFFTGVTFLPDRCFSGCTYLQSITIPSSVVEFKPGTGVFNRGQFYGCQRLSSLKFVNPQNPTEATPLDIYDEGGSDNVQLVGDNSLNYWFTTTGSWLCFPKRPIKWGDFTTYTDKLTKLYLQYSNPTEINTFKLDLNGNRCRPSLASDAGIYVPAGLIDTYKAAFTAGGYSPSNFNWYEYDFELDPDNVVGEAVSFVVYPKEYAEKSAPDTSMATAEIYCDLYQDSAITAGNYIGREALVLDEAAIYRVESNKKWVYLYAISNTLTYSTTDGELIESIPASGWGANLLANTVIDGENTLIFDEEPTSIPVMSGLSTLVTMDMPVGMTSIPASGFSGCSALRSIDIPSGVTSIPNAAFYGCTSLSSVTIPNSVIGIGNSAFYNCQSLSAVTLPSGLTTLGNSSFRDCSSLSGITIPNSVTIIGESALRGTAITAITIPDSVTSMGSSAIEGCRNMTEVHIGSGVTSLPNSFAYGCSGLTTVDWGNNCRVTSIGQAAFNYCTSLSSIAIPETVTSISNYAFNQCYSLAEIIAYPTVAPSIGSSFSDVASVGTLYAPVYADYSGWMAKLPSGWSLVQDVAPLAFTNTGSTTADITLNNVSGNTPNVEYSTDNVNWTTWDYSTLTIPAGETVYFRGTNPTGFNRGTSAVTTSYSSFSGTTGSLKVSGNLESLVDYQNETLIGGANDRGFAMLFYNMHNLTDASDLDLHLTTIQGDGYYFSLFNHCDSLVKAPSVLPATALTYGCYMNMFIECSVLTDIPARLPAATLAESCYRAMFADCTSITTSPALPAATLAQECYKNMFLRASSLNSIEMLATDISATDCLATWVDGVASTGTFVKDGSMTTLPTGSNGIPSGWTVTDKTPAGEYLTFVALEDGTFQMSSNSVDYSLDGGATWTTLAANTASPTVTTGNKIMWKGLLTPVYGGVGTFSSTGNFNVEGNAMSLLYGDNFIGQTDLTGKNYAFMALFRGCTKVINAENLILPATTLVAGCYQDMFRGCSGLTTAPELPAITLAPYCYRTMFYGCSGLTAALELPATSVLTMSYAGMFQNCTSLTTVPDLSALTLGHLACEFMFAGCTSLTTAPALPATTLAQGCYQYMFQYCTSLTAAPALPATTMATNCYEFLFAGCISLTTAPALPATTLAQGCYQYMFQHCSSLNYIKMLATDISASSCLSQWVSGVAVTGTFVKDASITDLPTGDNGIPEGWTVQDA